MSIDASRRNILHSRIVSDSCCRFHTICPCQYICQPIYQSLVITHVCHICQYSCQYICQPYRFIPMSLSMPGYWRAKQVRIYVVSHQDVGVIMSENEWTRCTCQTNIDKYLFIANASAHVSTQVKTVPRQIFRPAMWLDDPVDGWSQNRTVHYPCGFWKHTP